MTGEHPNPSVAIPSLPRVAMPHPEHVPLLTDRRAATAWMAAGATYRADVLGALAGPHLLVAMGLLLSVRAGALNLSVWACASLGSVLAWTVAAAGRPQLAVPVAMAGGAVAGLVQSVLVRRLRLPSAAVTAVVGLALMALVRYAAEKASLARLAPEDLGAFSMGEVRLLLAGALYATTMAALVLTERSTDKGELPTGKLAMTGLTAGAALSAGGGAIILLGRSEYVSQAYLLGDLRVAAAVALCGGWVWRGRGGALLAGMLLPPAMLAATIWRELLTVSVQARIEPALAGLVVMVVGLQLVIRGSRWTRWRSAGIALAWLGVAVTAMGAYWRITDKGALLAWVGGGLWVSGVATGGARLAAMAWAARSRAKDSPAPSGD